MNEKNTKLSFTEQRRLVDRIYSRISSLQHDFRTLITRGGLHADSAYDAWALTESLVEQTKYMWINSVYEAGYTPALDAISGLCKLYEVTPTSYMDLESIDHQEMFDAWLKIMLEDYPILIGLNTFWLEETFDMLVFDVLEVLRDKT